MYRWHSTCSWVISLLKALNSAGNKTMRSGETCERRLPLFWALLQHPQEARPSKAQRYDEGCLLHFSYLSGLEDLFLAMSSAHDQRPIWNFTKPHLDSAVQQAAAYTGLGTVTLHQLHHSGDSVEMARRCRTLDAVQKRACTGANTAVESQQTTENWLGRCEHHAKNAKKTPSKNLVGVTTSCASNTPGIDVAARSGLRVGFRCCRQRGKLGSFRWKSLLWLTLFAGGSDAARADEAQRFRAQAWDTIFDATRLNLSKCSPCRV